MDSIAKFILFTVSKSDKSSISTYQVTDSQGATIVKTITVTVNEKSTTPEEKPNNKPSKPNQKPSKTDVPKTGDATSFGLFASIFGGSGLMLFGLGRKKRKDQKKER